MWKRGATECTEEILLPTVRGPLVELRFTGRGEGFELSDLIDQAVARLEPVALVLDLSAYRYRGGDAIGGIASAFFARTQEGEVGRRPCAIVGRRMALRSLQSLFTVARVIDLADVHFFRSLLEARAFMLGRVTTTA
jgi:hypothetical protein